MKKVGIYKITSPSGKVYIGQSWDIEKRLKVYKNIDCKGQRKLHNSLLKYGYLNHKIEIVHQLPIDVEQDILDNYEILYIFQYSSVGIDLLNIKLGGRGGKNSEETKKILSDKFSQEHYKLYFSSIMKGRKNSLGRKISEQHKLKISAANKNKPKTEKQRIVAKNRMMGNTLGYGKTGANSNTGRKVTCLDNGITYDTIRIAANSLGVNEGKIPQVCRGKLLRTGGLKFKYA